MASRQPHVTAPDILAVHRDNGSREISRTGARISSDVLSVYLEGGPRYRLDGQTHTFTPPAAILVPEGTFDHDLQEGRPDGIYVLFHGRGLLHGSSSGDGRVVVSLGGTRRLLPNFKQVSIADAGRIAGLLREIAAVRDAGLTGGLRRISLLFRAIATYCDAGGKKPGGGIHREATRLRALIEKRPFEDLSMAQIYRELDISSAHAGMLFRAAYGMSPVAYRTQLRLRRARELLVSSQLNVGQVASAVGFTDALYFSRVFHKATGATPSSLIYDFGAMRR